jgi:pimeloyl-ACP methyl ester carboxylesterase
VVAEDEATKETVTATELMTVPEAFPAAAQITAPVLVVNGQYDQLVCAPAPPCDAPVTLFKTERSYYGQSASYDEVLIRDAGHSLTGDPKAPEFMAAVIQWLNSHEALTAR